MSDQLMDAATTTAPTVPGAGAPQIDPVPRVSIQVFCETADVAAIVQSAMTDRRMRKAHVKQNMGGAAAACEAYRSAPTPNVIILEATSARDTLLDQLDDLSQYCDAGTKVIVLGKVNDIVLYRQLIARGVSEYLVSPFTAVEFVQAVSNLFRAPGAKPLGRVVAVDTAQPDRAHWQEIVPERAETLDGAQIAGGKLILEYIKDAHSTAQILTLDGKPVSDVAMPGIGTAVWSPARLDDTEMFYAFTGYTMPTTYYRIDVGTGKSALVRESKVAFDAPAYETKQVFYNSKDGTRVPMFLSYRKGIRPDGNNPTILYGYGGFDIALTPAFSPAVATWMAHGGIYAVANLRGGSEYGEAWHEAGMRAKKQNVFDDFIAAAEWLIAHKYTSTPKLCIYGGSNGGLLVGAVLNQRPDLFGAAMPAVGVMDMLRFDKFGFGTQWTGEYGHPDNPADFKVIRAYSPLHNIRKGVKYPPVLITTADHDDRVMPGHSLKYAAALQQAQEGPAPILIRIDTRAGHGAGKPTTKVIDEWVDRFSFLAATLHIHIEE